MHSLAVIRMHGVLNLSILTQGFTPCNPGVSRVAALKTPPAVAHEFGRKNARTSEFGHSLRRSQMHCAAHGPSAAAPQH